MADAMIAGGVSQKTSHEVPLGHVVRNVTKFQSCRGDKYCFIGEKPSPKHVEKNNKNYIRGS